MIGQKPSRGVVSADNSRLYVSNFGSNAVSVYDIDLGRVIATIGVGSGPDALALMPSQNDLLVLDSQSGDASLIHRKLNPKKFEREYNLLTIIPLGVEPNNIAVKAFMLNKAPK